MSNGGFFKSYTTPLSDDVCNSINEANRELLTRFFKNNRYLRGVRGKGAGMQAKELKERLGFITTRQTILRSENNNFQTSNLRYLSALSIYWGFSLLDMIVRDFESEGVR